MKFASHVTYVGEEAIITALRPKHREYLSTVFEQGKLVLAGPFADGSGALFVHDVSDVHEAGQLIAADPFAQAGIFARVDTRPWNIVFNGKL